MRIGLLGTLQVRDDAGDPVRVGGHRVRSLLILLALEPGRVVPATALIARLWPDDPPADAANALQTLVSRLRAALRGTGVIESHAVGYRLVIEPGDVDAVAFETMVRGARDADTLNDALDLWRGPALADVADEEFAVGPAARLEELRLATLHDRIEAHLDRGESVGLVGELRALVEQNPLAERSRALLMRALAADGRQAEALAVYTQARALLAEQLGVDPSPDLEQTYLAVLRQDLPAPRRRGPVHLPSPFMASFVGRDADLDALRDRLARHRLVTLTGPGGIGKTRLATEAIAELENVHMVELARVTVGGEVLFAVLDTVAGRERSIARRAGEPPAGGDPMQRLSATLADRDALVILDNCEHVIDAAADVAHQLLASCPRVTILATSREPLRITGETLWPVSPLPEQAAVRLLAERAAAVRPGFAVDETNRAPVSRICQALDGMPLAIELAAASLRVLSPGQLAERLNDRFTVLVGGSRAALPRHQTLRAVVDWSWESLSKPERILARRLAVFPGGVTLEAAEGVCADESLARGEILAALSGLVDKSILLAGDGTRYSMLETIRAYGAERLAEAGEEERVRAAFGRYYLTMAEEADPRLRGPEQASSLVLLDAELDNIHAAVRMTIDANDGETALRFIVALGWYWMIRSNLESASLARAVLRMPADDSDPRVVEALAVCVLAAAGPEYDVDAIRADFEAAVRRVGECFPGPARIHPLAAFAAPMLALHDRQPERALAQFEEWIEYGDTWERAALTLMRSQTCAMLGRMREAEELLLAAVDAFRSVSDEWMLGAGLFMIADYTAIRGDTQTAIAALREAATLSGHLGAPIDHGHFEVKLAALAVRAGDLDAAREYLEQAGDMNSRQPDGVMSLDLVRAELAWAEGDLAETIRLCEAICAVLATKTSVWWRTFRGTVEARLGLAALRTGDPDRARRVLAEALRNGSAWVEQPDLATVLDAIAVLALDDDPALAATLLGAAHTLRGRFNESSLDSPAARDSARQALGPGAYDDAYRRGRGLTRDEAIALADSTISGPAPVRADG